MTLLAAAPTVETWRPIADYEGIYEVSDLGQIRRIRRARGARVGQLRPWMSSTGYPCVTLYRDGVGRKFKVHRLVAIAFVPGASVDLDVCHTDGDRLNAKASNLRWDTRSANMLDAVAHGTQFNHFRDRDHCANGHEFTEQNTLQAADGRRCRTCRRDRVRAWRMRQKAVQA